MFTYACLLMDLPIHDVPFITRSTLVMRHASHTSAPAGPPVVPSEDPSGSEYDFNLIKYTLAFIGFVACYSYPLLTSSKLGP